MRSTTARITRRTAMLGLTGGVALAGLTACSDFITGEGLTVDPNNPTKATTAQLLTAVQASLFVQQEGQLARIASMWTQQMSGTNNQQKDYGSSYLYTEGDVGGWNPNYAGGGITDLREIQRRSVEANEPKTQGMAMVIEALRFGTAISLWGDMPYSEAVNKEITAPKLDPQQEIYAKLQLKLDSAITLLGGSGNGPTPASADLVYNSSGSVTPATEWGRWVRAAYTIKARFHMHTAERLGAPAYQAAYAAALKGIDEAPQNAQQAMEGQAPGDFRAFHGSTVDDGNLWAQFLLSRQDMTANQQFITLLQNRNDPRLANYFDPAGDGQYRGSTQFGVVPTAGAAVLDAPTRKAYPYRQPIATWAENQLILAEAGFQTGQDDPTARVNAVRTAVGLPALAGPVTLAQIAEEKYVAMFQNIEAYNDFKRLCYPVLTPGGQNGRSAAAIPGRIVYPVGERQTNPNIPTPGAQPARNWNDPNACPVP